jgi:hypothetical protein
VHLRIEVVCVGDLAEQHGELLTFSVVQRSDERPILSFRGASELLERRPPGMGEAQRERPSIGTASRSNDQATILERVDERHDSARDRSEPIRERSLAESVMATDDPDDARIRRCESQWTNLVREPFGRDRAQLREEEGTARIRHGPSITSLTILFIRRMIRRMTNPSTTRTERGPHPGALAVVALVLTLVGLVVLGLGSGGELLTSPFGHAADVATRFHDHWVAQRVGAWVQFGSAVPLGIATASIFVRLQRLGVRVPGAVIALLGGFTASITLMVSALVGWVLSDREVTTSPLLTKALAEIQFAFGGVGFVNGIGLLVAGIAVPSLILRLVRRWLAWSALVVAALAELSFIGLVVPAFDTLLPIGRFGALAALVLFGFMLPKFRQPANRRA